MPYLKFGQHSTRVLGVHECDVPIGMKDVHPFAVVIAQWLVYQD